MTATATVVTRPLPLAPSGLTDVRCLRNMAGCNSTAEIIVEFAKHLSQYRFSNVETRDKVRQKAPLYYELCKRFVACSLHPCAEDQIVYANTPLLAASRRLSFAKIVGLNADLCETIGLLVRPFPFFPSDDVNGGDALSEIFREAFLGDGSSFDTMAEDHYVDELVGYRDEMARYGLTVFSLNEELENLGVIESTEYMYMCPGCSSTGTFEAQCTCGSDENLIRMA